MSWSEWALFVFLPTVAILAGMFFLLPSGPPLEPDCTDPTCRARCNVCGEHHNWRVLPKAIYDWEAEQERSKQ